MARSYVEFVNHSCIEFVAHSYVEGVTPLYIEFVTRLYMEGVIHSHTHRVTSFGATATALLRAVGSSYIRGF